MGRGNPTLPPVRRRGWPVRGRTEGLHPPPVQAQRPHPHPAPGAATAPKSPPYLDNPKKGYRHYTKQPLVLKRRQVSGIRLQGFLRERASASRLCGHFLGGSWVQRVLVSARRGQRTTPQTKS